ncbi:hypothetical protein NDU88_011164 [Pleurodeles waltl]|uniref:Uncharacterized protein n=1 Tax=Pleurodeles waltl TaxID=8319 RepID=A0AAV7PXD5_PLEWA|nr:hypothetical protein NDU88_011164 [Pleurodeles waltl]
MDKRHKINTASEALEDSGAVKLFQIFQTRLTQKGQSQEQAAELLPTPFWRKGETISKWQIPPSDTARTSQPAQFREHAAAATTVPSWEKDAVETTGLTPPPEIGKTGSAGSPGSPGDQKASPDQSAQCIRACPKAIPAKITALLSEEGAREYSSAQENDPTPQTFARSEQQPQLTETTGVSS